MEEKGVCDLFDPNIICAKGEFCWTCNDDCEGRSCPWWRMDYEGEVEIGEQYE